MLSAEYQGLIYEFWRSDLNRKIYWKSATCKQKHRF